MADNAVGKYRAQYGPPHAVICLLVIAACGRASGPATNTSSSSTEGAPAAPSAHSPVIRADSPRLKDSRWAQAAGEDPAGKQALADAVGAAELIDALGDGGEITRTALLCLPYADDAELALGPLARRALKAEGEELALILEALLGVAGRPATAREALDPEGAREAGEAMITIASRASLPREQRALAVSAARALAEKQMVDPAKIPADLDSP